MKLAIFGATGQIGRRCCSFAIETGCQVTALVRDPAKVQSDLTDQIRIIQGHVGDREAVGAVISGQDAVICCLGSGSGNDNPNFMSEGLDLILSSMKQFSVSRISVCLSTFLLWDPCKVPAFATRAHEQHNRMWNSLKHSEGIIWTAVLPPGFSDEPRSHGKYTVMHDKLVGRRISKDDLADFMLACLTQLEHENKSCVLGNTTEYLDAERQ